MLFDKVTVRVSELQTTTVVCAPWETPILQAIYGEDEAVVTGEEEVDRELPDPQDEFTRLAVRYGPKNSDTPVVAAVYGNFGPGFRALERAMQACVEQELEIPELSDERIAEIAAAHAAKQPDIIPNIEPQPPIGPNPEAKALDEVVEDAAEGAEIGFDVFDEDEGFEE